MGNGTSQSVVLGPTRYQSSLPMRNNYHPDIRGIPKYVHPQNRVLPKPVTGQRLRSTDNGNILQAAGTIRGQRRDGGDRDEQADPEFLGKLRRRSEMIEQQEDCNHHFNMRNHRMFHSDPNIARRPGYMSEELPENYTSRRSNGGVAMRASKLKYKKKVRAPDPPPSGSSLPRRMERRPQSSCSQEDIRNRQDHLACKCIGKSRAPQPPAVVVHPPPPPPLPNSVTTRTTTVPPQTSNFRPELSRDQVPRVTRSVETRTGYEKNVHPLEKWRNYKSAGDVRIDEEEEGPPSRTTVFDSKKISEAPSKIPSYLPQKPDPFQKEIRAVTKKIAETRHQVNPSESGPSQKDKSSSKEPNPTDVKTSSPPKFYFSDPTVFKNPSLGVANVNSKDKTPNSEGVQKADSTGIESGDRNSKEHLLDKPKMNEVPSLQRFSPCRQRLKSPNRTPTPTMQQRDWDNLPKSLYNKNREADFDVKLRPVLPRKSAEVPKFSPSDAWQALGSDGQGSSNHSTSDDGPEPFSPYKGGPLRASMNCRLRRPVDNSYESRHHEYKPRSMSDSHWTPRQDLLDDSDVSSEDSEDAVLPRTRSTGLGDISTRFSLPTVMFSNMRPIGSEMRPHSTHASYYSDSPKAKQPKKKTTKYSEPEYDDSPTGPPFRRFLSKKTNKYTSEEDIAVSDSNWTFGQHGLQKRGKLYSSEIMLSDKKRSELLVNNSFSDFLGDILTTKTNHMRNQMKSSDSGNSNFSFYSTEGQIMYRPIQDNQYSPQNKGRVQDMRKRFELNLESQRRNNPTKSSKKKVNPASLELGRRRDMELAKMLEDEVRKRRNKEKISIRQQLQRIKHFQTEDEEEDFDDEAYFTEPKSREESQSPFYSGRPIHNASSELGIRPFRFAQHISMPLVDSSRLSHWQSSPALLEDSVLKNGMHPSSKGRLSMSSVMSTPDSGTWMQPSGDSWIKRQQKLGLNGGKAVSSPVKRLTVSSSTDAANDGDVSSSPTPAPPKKERRKTNIYKQLMDIVKKEERHLKKAQRGEMDPNSRESSYSQRESSPSTCSSQSSSYSYSDSSSNGRHHHQNGVPANKEFGYRNAVYQAAQPYTPSKSYRPVPFDLVTSAAASGCRLPGLQEEGKHLQAGVS